MFNGKSLRKWIKENCSIHVGGEQGELLSFEPKKVKFTIFLKGTSSVWHQSISCNSSLWNVPLLESHDPAPNLCCFCLSKTHTEIKPTCAFWMHCGLLLNQMELQVHSKWGFDLASILGFSGICRILNTEWFGWKGIYLGFLVESSDHSTSNLWWIFPFGFCSIIKNNDILLVSDRCMETESVPHA